MIDLISNECSSHQTIKCALYKLSVMLEHNHLQQYFIQNEGMSIILKLLKSQKVFNSINYFWPWTNITKNVYSYLKMNVAC